MRARTLPLFCEPIFLRGTFCLFRSTMNALRRLSVRAPRSFRPLLSAPHSARCFSSSNADINLIVEQVLHICGSKQDVDDFRKFYSGLYARCPPLFAPCLRRPPGNTASNTPLLT